MGKFNVGDKVWWLRDDYIPDCGQVMCIIDGKFWVRTPDARYVWLELSQCYSSINDIYDPSTGEIKINELHESDSINPNYYKSGKYEIFDVLMDWIRAEKLDGQESALLFNTVKYLRRFKSKHPEDKTVDLKKAKWYLDKLIQYEIGDMNDGGAIS